MQEIKTTEEYQKEVEITEEEIEQLIKQSDYYKDICLMYDALLCKFRWQKKILKMKGRIKRWIFG